MALRPGKRAAQATSTLSLLVVDDDQPFRESLAALLQAEGFSVSEADSLKSAREALGKAVFDAVLCDQELPDGNGAQVLKDHDGVAPPKLIVITGHATVQHAVAALQDGAMDYLTKPLDQAKLQSTLANLRRTRALEQEVSELRGELRSRGSFASIVGRSAAMQAIFDLIQRVSPTDASVLIQGESGTGKELVANAIHALSKRREGPMLPVNCGAIPESLIESELFGHERGSFTGANAQHKGFFERADGGTLFLDEITEMPAQLQVKLLRVLETGKISRVGSSASTATNVRVLAASNRDPKEAIRQGKLREDLYFRLAVFPIELPPLRERPGDVELLATHFLQQLNEANGTDKRWVAGELDSLAARDWQGNVRELRNAVQRAFILTDDQLRAQDAISSRSRSADVGASSGIQLEVGCSIADAERELIEATLEHVRGDKAEAAKILGISLKTLYTRLNLYNAGRE
jgi:DNA-binding NtrC family response regulator